MSQNLRWTADQVAASLAGKDPRNVAALAALKAKGGPQTAPQAILNAKTPHDGPRKAETRLRQDTKPLMNKLEERYFKILCAARNIFITQNVSVPEIRPQAKRYRLGNGIWYKVDLSCSAWPGDDGMRETGWEVKGPHSFRGGFENLKVAAGLYPEVRFILVWYDDGWKTQNILP